jgi:hypothetical protein
MKFRILAGDGSYNFGFGPYSLNVLFLRFMKLEDNIDFMRSNRRK